MVWEDTQLRLTSRLPEKEPSSSVFSTPLKDSPCQNLLSFSHSSNKMKLNVASFLIVSLVTVAALPTLNLGLYDPVEEIKRDTKGMGSHGPFVNKKDLTPQAVGKDSVEKREASPANAIVVKEKRAPEPLLPICMPGAPKIGCQEPPTPVKRKRDPEPQQPTCMRGAPTIGCTQPPTPAKQKREAEPAPQQPTCVPGAPPIGCQPPPDNAKEKREPEAALIA